MCYFCFTDIKRNEIEGSISVLTIFVLMGTQVAMSSFQMLYTLLICVIAYVLYRLHLYASGDIDLFIIFGLLAIQLQSIQNSFLVLAITSVVYIVLYKIYVLQHKSIPFAPAFLLASVCIIIPIII
jgi:Flp pilus assembly protein protease CpaA